MKFTDRRKLLKYKSAQRTLNASRKWVLPGTQGLSLYIVGKFFIENLKNSSINIRASSLAFNLLLALFPSVIFLFTLIPYIPIDHFQDELFKLLKTFLPEAAFQATEGTIIDILKNPRGGLLSVGFISALIFSTNGFSAMIDSFYETYHVVEQRSYIMQRLVAFLIVLVGTVLLIVSIALILITQVIIKVLISMNGIEYYLIVLGQWVILFALCLCFISFTYFIGPKGNKKWNFFSPGAITATILTIITSLGFSFYINNFGNYNKLYGSIGTLIVFMLWLYLNSMVILIGFDLNASINRAKSIYLASKLNKQQVNDDKPL